MSYKLTYFNLTALGEPIRLILHYGKINFEDNRIEYGDDWPTVKQTLPLPYGQMPILEHDGKLAHQSLAICRYVAKLAKLVGENDWENLEIDAAADTVNDFRQKIGQFSYEKDPDVKEKKKEALFGEILPYYVEKLEEQIKNNNGYLAAGKLTWADLYLVGILDYLNWMLGKDLLEEAPQMKALYEKVRGIPEIKAYIDQRPKTMM
ncbi:unnamed protein product [Phyllotreta striolata]|uniref:glutathione transferase n=1 Tax=Phyllotreta striolata TaxID=444603 RepID=A0A9N9U1F2_PHYSR|nr:unnamed protein product [Phyllotreta striolata]